jgi:hypothetical protein
MSKSLSRLLAAMTCAASLSVYAAEDSDSRRPPQGKPHAPSQVAIDACKGLAEKDSCQFNGRDNETVDGVCAMPPPNGETTALSCRPNHRPNHSTGDAPPEPK